VLQTLMGIVKLHLPEEHLMDQLHGVVTFTYMTLWSYKPWTAQFDVKARDQVLTHGFGYGDTQEEAQDEAYCRAASKIEDGVRRVFGSVYTS
jgi:hypothetical protein